MLFSYSGAGVHFSVVSQKDSDDVGLVGPGRQMERGLAAHRRSVGVGAVLQQEDDDVHTAHEAGHVKRCQTGLYAHNSDIDEIVNIIFFNCNY